MNLNDPKTIDSCIMAVSLFLLAISLIVQAYRQYKQREEKKESEKRRVINFLKEKGCCWVLNTQNIGCYFGKQVENDDGTVTIHSSLGSFSADCYVSDLREGADAVVYSIAELNRDNSNYTIRKVVHIPQRG